MHATILNLSLSLSKLQVSNSKLCMHVMYDYDSVPTPRLQAPTKPKQSTVQTTQSGSTCMTSYIHEMSTHTTFTGSCSLQFRFS